MGVGIQDWQWQLDICRHSDNPALYLDQCDERCQLYFPDAFRLRQQRIQLIRHGFGVCAVYIRGHFASHGELRRDHRFRCWQYGIMLDSQHQLLHSLSLHILHISSQWWLFGLFLCHLFLLFLHCLSALRRQHSDGQSVDHLPSFKNFRQLFH